MPESNVTRTIGQAILDHHFPPEADFNSPEPSGKEQSENEYDPEESRNILWFKLKELLTNTIPEDDILSDAAKNRLLSPSIKSQIDLLKDRMLMRSSTFTKSGRVLRQDLTSILQYMEKKYEKELDRQMLKDERERQIHERERQLRERQCCGLYNLFGLI